MPRQLKTFVTTSGFFELAVAAPTMKAAIEIWGASADVFHRGYAKISDDPSIIKATMAKPGVVLKRGVGANGAFSENPKLDDIALTDKTVGGKGKSIPSSPPKNEPAKAEPARAKKADAVARQNAARLYQRSEKQRERERTRAEAAERKARERRDREIQKAEAALETAREEHNARRADIERKRAILERAAHDEDARWATERQRLGDAVRKARD